MAEARKIFFSYTRSDSEFVLRLANDLRRDGEDIWVDKLDIPKGARWDNEVEAALKACPCLLVVLSPVSTTSQNVLDEVSYALEDKKTVIPILLEKCNVPFRLKRLQYIDFTGDYEPAFQELRSALGRVGPQGGRPPRDGESTRGRTGSGAPSPSAVAANNEPASGGGAAAGIEVVARRHLSWKLLASVLVAIVAAAYFVPSLHERETGGRQPVSDGTPAIDSAPHPAPPVALPAPSREAKSPSPEASAAPAPEVKPTHASRGITDAQGKEFVARFIATANGADPSDLIRLYDDRVDYFDRGVVDKDYVIRDKQSYFRRWPEVRNTLLSEVTVETGGSDDTARMSFAISYQVHSPARNETKSGTAQNELQVRRVGGELKITAERQRVTPK